MRYQFGIKYGEIRDPGGYWHIDRYTKYIEAKTILLAIKQIKKWINARYSVKKWYGHSGSIDSGCVGFSNTKSDYGDKILILYFRKGIIK